MRVMISQPMNGISDEEVLRVRNDIKAKLEAMHIEVVDSFCTDVIKGSLHPGIYYLGRTLMDHLHNVDAVYFAPGWRDARGCRIEFAVCQEYGIKRLPEDFINQPEAAPIMPPQQNIKKVSEDEIIKSRQISLDEYIKDGLKRLEKKVEEM